MKSVEIEGGFKKTLADFEDPQDGRLLIEEIYQSCDRLVAEYGWQRILISKQVLITSEGKREFPIYGYLSPQKGKAIWLLAGVHGEEPAGPNAIAAETGYLAEIGKEIPMVVIPVCNPLGYSSDCRYPDAKRDKKKGHSVGDSARVLPNSDLTAPRKPESAGYYYLPEAKELQDQIVKLCFEFPPVFCLDLHEDEEMRQVNLLYGYSQGVMGVKDPVAIRLIKMLEDFGFKITKGDKTELGEDIIDGLVDSQDDSIDNLLAADRVFNSQGQLIEKPAAHTMIVTEIPTERVPLELRISACRMLIQHLQEFYQESLKNSERLTLGGN